MKQIAALTLLSLGMAITSVTAASAETYTIDKTHSSIGFSVSHLMVSMVKGEFTDYEGTVTFDPAAPEATAMNTIIQAASIDTRVADRDTHLRNADFLDVPNNPTLTFTSTAVKKDGDTYVATGDLTIRGVTKTVEIPLTINGPVATPFGSTAIGLAGQVKINRQDYGVSFNKQLDQGGLMVGDEVTIDVNIEAHKK